jgi:hypothetical protein
MVTPVTMANFSCVNDTAESCHLGLKRKFSFSHFRENFRENLFSFSRKFLNEKTHENNENFRESFRKNAKMFSFSQNNTFLSKSFGLLLLVGA